MIALLGFDSKNDSYSADLIISASIFVLNPSILPRAFAVSVSILATVVASLLAAIAASFAAVEPAAAVRSAAVLNRSSPFNKSSPASVAAFPAELALIISSSINLVAGSILAKSIKPNDPSLTALDIIEINDLII